MNKKRTRLCAIATIFGFEAQGGLIEDFAIGASGIYACDGTDIVRESKPISLTLQFYCGFSSSVRSDFGGVPGSRPLIGQLAKNKLCF
jgi:hypothetical protein